MNAGRTTIALLAVLLAGCGSGEEPAASEPGIELRGRTFLSTAVTENGNPRQLAGLTKVTLRFTDDGRLQADAGCNIMGGPVNLRGGRIEVTDLAITEMACDPAVHEQDTWLADLLKTAPSWRLDDSNLVVSSAGTELVMLDKTVAEPALPLQGTRWTVDMIMDGEVASTTPAGSPATVVFEQDTVNVDTGCNTGSGKYQVSGNTISVEPIATTKMACEPDRMTLENAVLGTLTGQVTYEIESDQLKLLRGQGTFGLRLRGERG